MPHHESFFLKLARAEHHIDTLHDAIDSFLKKESYSVVRHANLDRMEYVWIAKASAPLPDDWSIIIGDAIHNLRSCLDHLAFAIARSRMRRKDRTNVQFPIDDAPRVGGFVKATNGCLPGVPKKARAIIEGLQPYSRINVGPHPLTVLREWSNADKHHALHPVWGVIGGGNVISPVLPVEWEIIEPIFEDEAEVFRARFDAPDVDVQFQPRIEMVVPIAIPTTPKATTFLTNVLPIESLRGILAFIRHQVIPPLEPFVRPIE